MDSRIVSGALHSSLIPLAGRRTRCGRRRAGSESIRSSSPILPYRSFRPCARFPVLLVCILFAVGILALPPAARGQESGYPITPVHFVNVRLDDGFWAKRLETNRRVTIPHALAQCEITGRIRNFEIADSVLRGILPEGKFCGRYGFDDSDVFKLVEGMAYAFHAKKDDAALDRQMDSLIAKIASAQEQDGYLYTMRTMKPEDSWAKERWVNDRMKGSHELYNAGHLYEAAVAHFAATGKRTLLEVALKSADLLVASFGPGKMHTVPGHQVTEMGLVKLYQVTGNRAYLELADFFIQQRGRGMPQGETYNQDHIPVLEQSEAVGHAVRAGYLYAGMADVAVLKPGTGYLPVLEKLWEDVVAHKLYITGGIGAAGNIEGFGPRYELPNLSAYCETCAGIALAFWSHRMFLHSGDAKYMDVLERVLYNGFLSGVSMTGDRFFYPNPLETIHGTERSPWFTCACCPPNDIRFLASLPGYAYATRGRDLYVNLYMSGSASIPQGTGLLHIRQATNYPWDGRVTLTMGPGLQDSGSFSLRLRIPGWALGKPLPGNLYTYRDQSRDQVRISINGSPAEFPVEHGYAVLTRKWRSDDQVELLLPMQVRRVSAHEQIVDDRGKVALERGPIVYCLEGPDQPEPWLLGLVIPDSSVLSTSFRADLLGGVQTISGFGIPTHWTLEGGIRAAEPKPFVAIPYYAWAHRGKHQMTVWPASESKAAKPKPAPTLAYRGTLTVSGGRGGEAINDQLLPSNSNDPSLPRFHWWPKKGTTEWVQYHFPEPERISEVTTFWFDDSGSGECRVPASWEILYLDGATWKPVGHPSLMSPEKDKPNRVTFDPVVTSDLRLSVRLRDDFSGGLYEWTVR